MSAFSTLLALINAQIKTNGLKAITGAKLNGVLVQMVNELGSGYQFIDIATPATNPGTPDENVWYIASQAGTYTNFGGIIVNENEVCALVWNGSWTKKVTGAATAAQVSQLGQEIIAITGMKIKGKGNVQSMDYHILNLIGGRTYTFKPVPWSIDSITDSYAYFVIGYNDGESNHDIIVLHKGTDSFIEEYSIDAIEANYYYIRVRGDNGVDININIYSNYEGNIHGKMSFIGANDDLVYSFPIDVLEGNRYRVHINDSVDMTEVTILDAARFVISAMDAQGNSEVLERVGIGVDLLDYYDVIIPAGYNKLRIGGRCTQSTHLSVSVEDITIPIQLEEKITNILNPLIGIKTEGNPTTLKEIRLNLIAGQNYTFKPTPWNISDVPDTYAYFVIGYNDGESNHDIIVLHKGADNFEESYTIRAIETGYYYVKVRGNLNSEIKIGISSSNGESLYTPLSFWGDNNTLVYSEPLNKVIGGNTYRVYIDGVVDMSGVSEGGGARFLIVARKDGSADIVLARTAIGTSLNKYYDVNIPAGYSLVIGGRCTSHTSLNTLVQDITCNDKEILSTSQFVAITGVSKDATKKHYYKISSSISVSVPMSKANDTPILLCIDGLCTSSAGIIVKYNNDQVTNGIVVNNTSGAKLKEILLPPYVYNSGYITLVIDSGILFKEFSLSYYNKQKSSGRINVAAHLGAVYGYNNVPAFQMAAKCGYKFCVTNLRKTLDNVLVCAHNDTYTVGGVTYRISQQNYSQINGWVETTGDAAYTKKWETEFDGFALPTADIFLRICMTTGMHPIFSIDPADFSYWSELKTLTDKWGFKEKASISIKIKGAAESSAFTDAYAVFGNIARYYTSMVPQTLANVEAFHTLDLGDSVKIVEDWSTIDSSVLAKALEYGIKVSIYEAVHDYNSEHLPLDTNGLLNCIQNGITEITTDSFMSDGLCWA